MKRHFNTTGPVIPEQHYCVAPIARLDWDNKIWQRQEQWQTRSIGAWGM